MGGTHSFRDYNRKLLNNNYGVNRPHGQATLITFPFCEGAADSDTFASRPARALGGVGRCTHAQMRGNPNPRHRRFTAQLPSHFDFYSSPCADAQFRIVQNDACALQVLEVDIRELYRIAVVLQTNRPARRHAEQLSILDHRLAT